MQGFGGAMMTPVGRLILLRSFPRAGLVSAMNWMTIPAMIGPMVGPIVGGAADQLCLVALDLLSQHPDRRARRGAGAVAVREFPRAGADALRPASALLIAGLGPAFCSNSPSRISAGRSSRRAAGFAFFPIAIAPGGPLRAGMRGAAQSPVLDLSLLKIKTFRIGTVTGGICRMGLDATPFMLPLLFQVGFGLSPMPPGC